MAAPRVLVTVFVRDKEHTLPLFLATLEAQTWPRARTGIYIRANACADRSVAMLQEWTARMRSAPEPYAEIHEDYAEIPGAEKESSREWTSARFRTLGRLRQESIEYARARSYDAVLSNDADNFIFPHVLARLMQLRHLGIVAPLLYRPLNLYSNFYLRATSDGFMSAAPAAMAEYRLLHARRIRGIVSCDVVHCTYIISREFFDRVKYIDDESELYEYIIFSNALRAAGVPQLLDSMDVGGALTLARDAKDFEHDRAHIVPQLRARGVNVS